MHKQQSRSRLLIFVATLLFISTGTYLMIRYAQGYRATRTGIIKGTGLLSANSFPTAAEVYVDGRLTSATDATLNLDPGEYEVEIKKDGYHSWKKSLTITEELVTETRTLLFPSSPALEPLTYIGSVGPVPAPSGDHLAFTVASASASTKNGLYVQDLSTSALSVTRSTRQIAQTTDLHNYLEATYTWSPNGSEILVAFKNGAHLLLDTSRFNSEENLKDVTVSLGQTLSEWESELARDARTSLLTLPDFMIRVATSSATNIYFSPDGEKLLYQATSELTIPDNLIPPLPASSTQTQSRTLQPGSWYVYDAQEDRNFLVAAGNLPLPNPSIPTKSQTKSTNTDPTFIVEKKMLLDSLDPLPAELVALPAQAGTHSAFRKLQTNLTAQQSLALFNAQYSPIFAGQIQWYPNSDHLILTTDKGIDIIEYDGTNRLTLYEGPMDSNFVYPWPDGSRLITRIQFSPDTVPNLYTIKLK